jgi:tryptophan-rich sensory protein
LVQLLSDATAADRRAKLQHSLETGRVILTASTLVPIGVALFLGVAGGLLTEIGPWYRDLRKPKLNPPNWAFGPAWTLILGLAAWSAIIAWEASTGEEDRRLIILLFGANATLHLLWSPLFFKFKRPDWALMEVVFLWASLVALVIGLAPISRTASLLIWPYLLWVSFATWLNWRIVRLNPRSVD